MTDDPDFLMSGYLDGTLTKQQQDQLGDWIEADAAHAKRFAEASLLDNQLHARVTAAPWMDASREHAVRSDITNPRGASLTTPSPTQPSWKLHLAYATARSTLAFFGWWSWASDSVSQNGSIACITTTKDCKWGGGTLPTAVGSRLQPGRLELIEGFAKLSFDNGVQLSLEAPIQISLSSPTHCEVHSGQLVASVPGPEIQFVVTTATTEILDLGTEFAVRVEPDGNTGVHVLSGQVDVTNRTSGESRRLAESQAVLVDAGSISETNSAAEVSLVRSIQRKVPVAAAETNAFLISTAQGRGRDAFVYREQSSDYTSSDLLLVKHCLPQLNAWDRKVYLALDVGSLQGFEIESAELRLNLMPSELGLASHQPDSIFQLYGMIDESRDDWDEKTITWDNAPAGDSNAASVHAESTIHLGSFKVRQGIQRGTVQMGSEQLRDFIEADTNGVITIILVRETQESKGNGLVHAFASKEHPSGMAPVLRVVCRSSTATLQ